MTRSPEVSARREQVRVLAKTMTLAEIAAHLQIERGTVNNDLRWLCIRAQRYRGKGTLAQHRLDRRGSQQSGLTASQRADFRFLQKQHMTAAEALTAIGRPDRIAPALPKLTHGGAYDRADLWRYLKEAAAYGMKESVMAFQLNVPTHRVVFMMARMGKVR